MENNPTAAQAKHASDAGTAKQQVLDFVRSKNPQTMEHEWLYEERGTWRYCKWCKIFDRNPNADEPCSFGSELGLEELLLTLGSSSVTNNEYPFFIDSEGYIYTWEEGLHKKRILHRRYNLTLPLHRQDESDPEFFVKILPLIPDEK